MLAGRIEAPLAASIGRESADEAIKYVLAGTDVVMTTSALLRNGPHYVEKLLADSTVWLQLGPQPRRAEMRGVLRDRRAQRAARQHADEHGEVLDLRNDLFDAGVAEA